MNILTYHQFIRQIISALLGIISLYLSVAGRPTIPHGEQIDMSKFELTWADEFNDDTLDLDKWSGHGYANGGTALRRGGYWNNKLATVENGSLHIATKYFPDGIDGNEKPGWYSCGINTKNSFSQRYGYFECRCILPKGTGQWAAFWMSCEGVADTQSNGEKGAEIDIFESPYYHLDGKDKNSVSSNLHINGYGPELESEEVSFSQIIGNDPYEEYNTYGVEWNENGYIFYINGVETGRSDFGVSKAPEWMILSVEVGGNNAQPEDSWAGPAIDKNTDELTDFIIDYVRVYQYK